MHIKFLICLQHINSYSFSQADLFLFQVKFQYIPLFHSDVTFFFELVFISLLQVLFYTLAYINAQVLNLTNLTLCLALLIIPTCNLEHCTTDCCSKLYVWLSAITVNYMWLPRADDSAMDKHMYS